MEFFKGRRKTREAAPPAQAVRIGATFKGSPITPFGLLMQAVAHRDQVAYQRNWEIKESDPHLRSSYPDFLKMSFAEAANRRFCRNTSLRTIVRFCNTRRAPFISTGQYSPRLAIDLIGWAIGKNPKDPDLRSENVLWHLKQLFEGAVEEMGFSDSEISHLIATVECRYQHSRGNPYPMAQLTESAPIPPTVADDTRAADTYPHELGEEPAQDFLDFGSILLPRQFGDQVRCSTENGIVNAIVVTRGSTHMYLQVFASAPGQREWDAVRRDVHRGALSTQGALIEDISGPFGTELWIQVPVEINGKPAIHKIRTLAYEGSTWFLKGAIGGESAFDAEFGKFFEGVFREVTIVPLKGQEPRTLLPLHEIRE